VEFNYVSHVWGTPPGISIAARYDLLWDELAHADRLGFDYAMVPEHHFNPDESWMTDPTVFLASGAMCTERLRLAPMGYMPSLWNPIRLVETIAMLDNALHGRLDIGLASGVGPMYFGPFGADYSNRREHTIETAEILQAAYTSDGTFSYEGKFHSYRDVTLAVMPSQRPHPPIWIPSRDDKMLEYCAHKGFHTGFLWLTPRRISRPKYERFLGLWQAAAHTHRPKISYGTLTYVAETDAKALERAKLHIPNAYRAGAGPPSDDGGARAEMRRKMYIDRGEPETAEYVVHGRDVDWMMERNLLWVGSPDTVARQIVTAAAETPFNVVNAELNYGLMDRSEVWESTALFAEEVIPKVRDLDVC
jgi:alkanesulfonate monooxygenase SsuD/methylene tetrahydromethanopterin reductase-like flavin-dependent oxidoreductase (luciferase family)